VNKNSTTYIIGFIVILCIVFGAGVSAVHYATLSLLEKNEQLHRNRTLVRAFGIAVSSEQAEVYNRAVADSITREVIRAGNDSVVVFRTTGTEPQLGFQFSGMGFWDRITGIVVLSPDLATIRALEIFDQKETPGLGARIEEPAFKKMFAGIEPAWDDQTIVEISQNGAELANGVDAITGATQTSMALESILNRSLRRFRQRYRSHGD